MWNKAQVAGATPEIKDFLLLAYDPSPWTSELYMTVTKEVPNAKNVKLSGTFISKVFDGPYNAVPKWLKEWRNTYMIMGRQQRVFLFTHYLPQMCEYYGHNYVAHLLSQKN
jgi:hypothetical protein